MTSTEIQTQEPQAVTNEPVGDQNLDQSAVRLPNILVAALILLGVNIVMAAWFYFSPPLTLKMSASVASEPAYTSKPSPFTPVVDERRRPVKAALKLRPVLVHMDELIAAPDTTHQASYSADPTTPDMPVRSVAAKYSEPQADTSSQRYISGERVHDIVAREFAIATVKSERISHTGSVGVAPRAVPNAVRVIQ
jgi:hypothetical protein